MATAKTESLEFSRLSQASSIHYRATYRIGGGSPTRSLNLSANAERDIPSIPPSSCRVH